MKSLQYAPLALAVFVICHTNAFAKNSQAGEASITVTASPSAYTVNNLDNNAKFAESLLKTPRSIMVIPRQVLEDTNANTLTEALQYVPGISFKSGDALARPAGDHPFFRGFDGLDALLLDGVRSTAGQNRESFAVENVEVIKGSSSIYNGRGNAGGSVNIVSKKPIFGDAVTKLSGSLGTDNYRRVTLDTNQVFNDQVAGRFNAVWHQNDKPKRNAVEYKRWGVAPSLLFNFNNNTSLLLSYYHFQSDDIPDYSVPFLKTTGAPLESSRSQFYGLRNRDYINFHIDTPELIFSHEFADGSAIKSTAQYSKVHQQFIATSPKYNANLFAKDQPGLFLSAKSGDFRTQSFSELIDYQKQFDWGITSHKFSAGLEYTWEENQRMSIMVRDVNGINIRSEPKKYSCTDNAFTCARINHWNAWNPWTGTLSNEQELSYPPTKTTNNTVAAYLFDSASIADKVIVSAGIRLDHYHTKVQNQMTNTQILTRSDNFVNWQLGLVYQPIDLLSVYASYSTSSSPTNADAIQGGIPQADQQDLKAEKYQSAEVGIKWQPVKDHLLLSAALFNTTKRNGAISLGNSEYALVGKQRVQGLEVSAEGNITDHWSVFTGYSLLDSKVLQGVAGKSKDIGKRIPLTPQQSASIWTKYKITADFSVGAGLAYMGKIYTNPDNSNIAPAYTTVNLMAKYKVSNNFTVQLNVHNLADRKYYDTLYGAFATYGGGRQITASVDYRF